MTQVIQPDRFRQTRLFQDWFEVPAEDVLQSAKDPAAAFCYNKRHQRHPGDQMTVQGIRSIATALLLVCADVGICSVSRSQAPPPPPPPALDYSPAKWPRFTFESGRFSACFPGKPSESVESSGSATGPDRHVVEYKGLLSYGVTYADFGRRIDEKSKVQDLLQALKSVIIKADKEPEVKLVEQRKVEVQGYEGLYFQLDEGDKRTVRFELVPVGSRLFIISVEGQRGLPGIMGGKDNFAKIAAGFIGSFQITP